MENLNVTITIKNKTGIEFHSNPVYKSIETWDYYLEDNEIKRLEPGRSVYGKAFVFKPKMDTDIGKAKLLIDKWVRVADKNIIILVESFLVDDSRVYLVNGHLRYPFSTCELVYIPVWRCCGVGAPCKSGKYKIRTKERYGSNQTYSNYDACEDSWDEFFDAAKSKHEWYDQTGYYGAI
jgi:hypothetical protein